MSVSSASFQASCDALPEVPGAYRWWYVDGTSEDGRKALVAIFFWGSVFSPHYASRLLRGEAPHPREHAALHVALYQDGRRVRWLFVERRGEIEVRQGAEQIAIGRSLLTFSDRGLTASIDEGHGPLGSGRLRGEVSLVATAPPLSPGPLLLSPGAGDHRWFPRMPEGRLSAAFEAPGFRFEGSGYHDGNWGSEPLGKALAGWNWWRKHHRRGSTEVSYQVTARDGRRFCHVLQSGCPPTLSSGPAAQPTKRSGWGIALPPTGAMLETTPFYARYLLPDARGVGETLDLTRLDSKVVRSLLRFRTWRAAPLGPERVLQGAA